MKEFAELEQKAKRYDEAYKVAENIHRFSSNIAEIKRMEEIFPELKEGEDERIRKELITHCRNTRCVTEEGAERIAKWIAWLEKQSQFLTKKDEDDAYLKGINDAKKELEKQGEHTLKAEPDGMQTLNTWSEEDENVLNNLIAFLKVEDELKYDWKQIIVWLESLKKRIGW